jgi:hypothetical protein
MQSRKANYFNKFPVARLVLLIAGFSAVGIGAACLVLLLHARKLLR